MWSLHLLLLAPLFVIQINGRDIQPNSFQSLGLSRENRATKCKDKPCIRKCCGFGEYTKKQECYSGLSYNYSDIPVYDENLNMIDDIIPNVFELIPRKFKDEMFHAGSYSAQAAGFRTFLMTNGLLKLELPNAYDRFRVLNRTQFCVEYRVKKNSTTELMPVYYIVLPAQEQQQSSAYITTAIYISCFFLLLVLIVYSLLKELRNLGGKILMAYVGSLLMAFFLLALIQLPDHEVRACQCLTYFIYFFFLSTFCWMSVMSYDIWWTFRGYAKARPIHRRGENFKFIMYCIYAWGLPFCMAIAFAILNEVPMSDYPWLVTPKIPKRGCFLEGGEKFLYLYCPMLILIICNWSFYLMTAHNLWRLSRGTSVLDSAAAGTPAAHRSQRHRFMVYLKLSIVMGLNWLLEVVSFLYPGFRVWYLTDAYNMFIGLAIFLIFCCKQKIFRKLVKIFKNKKIAWSPSTHSSSTTSNSSSSQETSLPPLICNNPKGLAIQMKPY
ncbi:hypothetical protein K1T71_007647 [Dendrolimus kikuchii]|uniref:Uncharacterized protein n=1 Tax=Dendrolimus kikuchii TaxID=765133 RepID=A0ACC1CXU6_9NEOP|nr:hypothetical protein K1T71_007647 [Dendrolimus kikuchii]